MSDLASLVPSDEERRARLVEVLVDAFGDLIAADPDAFRRKFRKMAGDPFAFLRGSAAVFFADLATLDDPWVDERTGRVWIQGDLHAENYGTYMDAEGVLVFDVNDFDEAYVAPFTWDVRRMAASVALLGLGKAVSDAWIERLITAYAGAYVEQVTAFHEGERDDEMRLTLVNTGGAVREALLAAREGTRVGLLDRNTVVEDGDRRFTDGGGVRRLDDAERDEVLAAYERYLTTIPEPKRFERSISYEVKDVVGRSGFGIGSAGLPAYNLLVEGPSQALENDVILSMKQGNVAAPSRVVRDERIAGAFEHHGHRTAVSQRALQAHADPWLGWCEVGGTGFVVKELSPYEEDLDWDGVHEPADMEPLLRDLGRATAKVHCVADADADRDLVPFQVEEAIVAVVGDRGEEFAADMAAFGAAYAALAREDHRRFVDAFRNGEIPGLEA